MTPQSIKARQDILCLEIGWSATDLVQLPYRFLRGRCPCANCVNEMTGVRTFHVEQAATDVKPVQLEYAGNYALKIFWSDGHSTGLYAWGYLSELCAEHLGSTHKPK
jgi:DUF971 family protein